MLGILFKLTIAHRFKILSLVTYLAMGWLSLVVIYEMAVKLAAGSVTLLAVGGVVLFAQGWDFLRLQTHSIQPCHLARLRARR